MNYLVSNLQLLDHCSVIEVFYKIFKYGLINIRMSMICRVMNYHLSIFSQYIQFLINLTTMVAKFYLLIILSTKPDHVDDPWGMVSWVKLRENYTLVLDTLPVMSCYIWPRLNELPVHTLPHITYITAQSIYELSVHTLPHITYITAQSIYTSNMVDTSAIPSS